MKWSECFNHTYISSFQIMQQFFPFKFPSHSECLPTAHNSSYN